MKINNKTVKKKSDIKKTKTLFDHINHIYQIQDKNYFETLSDSDKKTWNNYMINRFISMNPAFLEIVNYVQKYSTLQPELYYKLLINIIPRGRYFFPYVKNRHEEYDSRLIGIFNDYFKIKSSEASMYIDIFMVTNDGKNEIYKICSKHGIEDAEIRKMI